MTSAWLDLLFPRVCACCGGTPRDEAVSICWDCRAQFTVIGHPFCRVCGDPVDGHVGVEYTCSWCTEHRPGFDQARSAVRFRGTAQQAIHALKYGSDTSLRKDLTGLLEACVATWYTGRRFDVVACVPLHPRRERERSYNQSALLADGLARRLRLPAFKECLARTRFNGSQTSLNANERRRNVRGAFEPRHIEWIEGRRFLLVDDVMTTGATLHECATVLKTAGAASVHVATVARG